MEGTVRVHEFDPSTAPATENSRGGSQQTIIGRTSMQQTQESVENAPEKGTDELIKLIRKLRWIGLQSEAKELQSVLDELPSPRHGSMVAGPHATD
jgi:hypothetical protein